MRSIDDMANISHCNSGRPHFYVAASVKPVCVRGMMPGHSQETPKFGTRESGLERGIVAGTIKVNFYDQLKQPTNG